MRAVSGCCLLADIFSLENTRASEALIDFPTPQNEQAPQQAA